MPTIKKTIHLDLWDDIIDGSKKEFIAACIGKDADNDIDNLLFTEMIENIVSICKNNINLDDHAEWLIEQMESFLNCETPLDERD